MKPATYKKLLKDLQKLQKRLVTAYEDGVRADPDRMAWVTERWKVAEVGGRVDQYLDVCVRRSAVQLLLRMVYVRVLEDLGTLDPPRIRGQWGIVAFKEVAPSLGIRGYLRWVFRDLAKDFPALFTPGPDELPLPPEDLLREIWDLWHCEDGNGGLVYDWQAVQGQPASFDSRFLGDLYQDLDREVRKRFALLQTPVFVEEYILDHTLTPALAEFDPLELRERGETFRLIDPTCGSGHFLIGAFHRLADWWRDEHGLDEWGASARAMESVWGADVNPHAINIAAFRLLLAVQARNPVVDLTALAAVELNLRALDSLIPWERSFAQEMLPGQHVLEYYGDDDDREDNASFFGGGFHAVVGNPPFVAPRHPKKRKDYSEFFPSSARRKYTMSSPFIERFIEIARPKSAIGLINAINFARRDFGEFTVTKVLAGQQLTRIVDCESASIPGHEGIGTAILFLRKRHSIAATDVIVGTRPPPKNDSTPPCRTWRDIVRATNRSESTDYAEFKTIKYEKRCSHPWEFLGTGTEDSLARHVRLLSTANFGKQVNELGFTAITSATGLLHLDVADYRRFGVEKSIMWPLLGGRDIRDYSVQRLTVFPAPYEPGSLKLLPLTSLPGLRRLVWPHRTWLRRRFVSGGTTMDDVALPYHAIPQFAEKKATARPQVVYAAISSHWHASTTREPSICTQNAMVIQPSPVTEDCALDLLGSLCNSLMNWCGRTVFQPKPRTGEDWENRYERTARALREFPYTRANRSTRIELARSIEAIARRRSASLPQAVFETEWDAASLSVTLSKERASYLDSTRRMVAIQEELDWLSYKSFGLIGDTELVGTGELEPLLPGHRPFAILAARSDNEAPLDEKSAWWDRHGHAKVTEVPDQYSAAHRTLIQARMDLIEADEYLKLLESFPYKRRWQLPDLEEETTKAAEGWLLDRLEGLLAEDGALSKPHPYRLEEIVAAWTRDPRVAAAAAVYEATSDVDLTLVAEKLLAAESLPDNPHRLYSASGLRKLDQWKEVWVCQEREDAGEDLGIVSKPPQFKAGDFLRKEHFSIRGKLNVPRERFIAYQDLTPTRYGWNGWRDLDRGLAQVEAFTEAESDAYNPLPPPTHDDPRRCGVTLGLWESLDDVRRWSGADHHIELLALAQEACRQESCPCEVVKRWQRWNGGEIEITTDGGEEVLEVTLEDRAFLAQLLVQYGVTGATAQELGRASGWSAQRVQLVLDDLVATGSVGKSGRGARTLYALPESALPQQKLF